MNRIMRCAAVAVFAWSGSLSAQTLTVTEAARLTAERHPSRASARANVLRAESGVRDARAVRLPLVGTEASLTQHEEPMLFAPLHRLDQQHLPIFDRTLIQGSLNASYLLYDGGARGARIDRAETLVSAAEAGDAGIAKALLADGVRAYVDVATTAEVSAAHSRRIAAMVKERDRAAQLFREGRVARVILMRAEAALSAAQADSAAAESASAVAIRELSRLTGVEAAALTTHRPASIRVREDDAAISRERAIASARASNPELLRLQRQLAAAEHGRVEARSLLLPRVNLGGRFIEYAAGSGDTQGEWQGGVQVSYPLLTGGTRQAARERAEADIAAARAELATAELRIEEAIDRAIAALAPTRARINALMSAVAQAEEVTRIERLALDAGTGLQSDYLTAEAELFRLRAALSEANASLVLLHVDIARIQGEISLDWIASHLGS